MTTFGLVLFPDAEELDFVGPWEVFTASSMLREQQGQRPDRALMLAQTLDPVRCNKGMRVLPDLTFDDHQPLDVLLVPGGIGTRVQVDNQQVDLPVEQLGRLFPPILERTGARFVVRFGVPLLGLRLGGVLGASDSLALAFLRTPYSLVQFALTAHLRTALQRPDLRVACGEIMPEHLELVAVFD